MSIIPEWDNNKRTIIFIRFVDDWTWDEFVPAREIVIEMLQSVSHQVDFIADFRNINHIPHGALSVGRSIRNTRLPNEGIALIVGTSYILRMLFQSFVTAFPSSKKEFILVSTLDEAREKIADIQQNRNNE